MGRVFRATPAALDTMALGATSFATTTPTIVLYLPADTVENGLQMCMIPLEVRIAQTGTVAGAAVNVVIEADNANRYTSGGTAATRNNVRPQHGRTSQGLVRFSVSADAIVATDAVGTRLAGYTIGQDVSPAEGAVQEVVWTPESGIEPLECTASLGSTFLVYTYAGTTGPTVWWSIKWAEFPAVWLGN